MPEVHTWRSPRPSLRHGHLHGMPNDYRRHSPSSQLSGPLCPRDGGHHGMNAAFDVVVVGAGPGGIAAAAVAAEAGMHVCLLDNNPASGGQIWRGLTTDSAGHSPHGRHFTHWTKRLSASGCSMRLGVEVVDCPVSGRLLLESEEGAHHLAFNRLILATGARERFLPFTGWTLPGVLGVGGLQALVKSGLDPAGKRVVVAGSGPLLLAAAAALKQRGASVQ